MDYSASYLQLSRTEFEARIGEAEEQLRSCHLCPRECGADRASEKGFCQAGSTLVVSSFGPHMGEESVLAGRTGSGTIFFGHCNLRCVYCQNYQLSILGSGSPVTSEQLASMMLIIQDRYKCPNINLVTPTHYVPQILQAVYTAAQRGLRLPLVYNCGGYESAATLQLLDGVVDIYMPDLKYASPERGLLYSQAEDYFVRARLALLEMDRQVGGLQLDAQGVAQRGLLVRHLVLPGGLEDTKKVLDFIAGELSPDCMVNLMDQYYPCYQADRFPELKRRLSAREYDQARQYAQGLGLRLYN
ncbi:MAG: radical SAM protein [Limnochordia bacterium]|jgi:putative pyruvate formate lyase activating enzyme